MAVDPSTERSEGQGSPRASGKGSSERDRRRAVALAGHRRDRKSARAGLTDPAGSVRAAALGALARARGLTSRDLMTALADPEPVVRRRVCELAAVRSRRPGNGLDPAVRGALSDSDPLVVEAACWALGERRDVDALAELGNVCRSHADPRCREAAVAALGAIGDPRGLDAVLDRLEDKPAIRRRAVVALAAFDDPAADAALRRCLDDRDWQVRQAAETLLEA